MVFSKTDTPLIAAVVILVPLGLGLFLAWCGREGAKGDTTWLCTSCVTTGLCGVCQLLNVALVAVALAAGDGVRRGGFPKYLDMGTEANIASLFFGVVLAAVCIKSTLAANDLRKSLVAVTVLPVAVELTVQVAKPQPEA